MIQVIEAETKKVNSIKNIKNSIMINLRFRIYNVISFNWEFQILIYFSTSWKNHGKQSTGKRYQNDEKPKNSER